MPVNSLNRFTVLLMVTGLFGASAAEFTFGNKVLIVPDGYEIECIAAPPLVSRPISASFDEQGRLYVTESSGNSSNAQAQLKNPTHQILRLEDSTGSGRFDRRTVFADKLMFPEGCLWLNGSLYVSGVPQIWKFTDKDGDGLAETREVWHDGKTVTGCANDLHGPYAGLDGWIYWCKGAWGQQTYERPGKKPLTSRAAHIFRMRPDGSGIETVLTCGMDNPVGVAFAPNGERFLSCTFYEPGNGKRDGLIHAIYGGVYGKISDSIYEHKLTGDVLPGLTHAGAAAPCGMICAGPHTFEGEGEGNLFACYFNLHKVMRHVLIPDGATYTTQDYDFVSSSNVDFHPTDVLEDADGSLIVVDTGGWYKVCCPTSQIAKPDIYGAIYRIRKKNASKVDDPRGLKIEWGALGAQDLASLLGDIRDSVVKRTIQELAKKGGSAIPALRGVLEKSNNFHERLNALWTLARIEAEEARLVVRLGLKDKNPTVIHAACHIAGLWRDAHALEPLIQLLTNPDPGVIRASAEALGRLGDPRAVSALLAAAGALKASEFSPSGSPASDAQRILDHSLIYALIEIGAGPETQLGLVSASAQTQRAAMVALDQMDSGALQAEKIITLLDSKDPILKRTAKWIIGHRSDWGAALAVHFRKRLAGTITNSDERKDLEVLLGRLAKSHEIQEMLAQAVKNGGASSEVALAAMLNARLKETPEIWFEALTETLKGSDPGLFSKAVAVAVVMPQSKNGNKAFMAALLDVGHKPELATLLRLQAISATGHGIALDSPLFTLLVEHIYPSQDPSLRSLAIGILNRALLTTDQLSMLAGELKQVSPLDLPQLLSAFANETDETTGLKLVDSLKRSAGLRALRVEMLKSLFEKFPKSVQVAGAALLDALAADTANQAAHLEELSVNIKNGNAERGKLIFSSKGACATCHTKGGIGLNFGPDLSTVNKVRSERDLLEAIVFPSASFVRSYEPYTVQTNAGETLKGILREDAPGEVVLAINAQVEKRIARRDIKRMFVDASSLMPQGFDQILKPQELADLIAFLKTQ